MTMTRTLISSTLIAAATVVGLCSVAPDAAALGKTGPGGYFPIDNVNDPHILELGRWAVSEHVKQARDGLVFSKVVSGMYQVVSGMNYKLVLVATDADGSVAAYRALVYEQWWTNTRKLTSFTSVN